MNPLWLIKQSLQLDFKFLKRSGWPLEKKAELIIKKYLILIKHFFKEFKVSSDSIRLFGKEIYYGTKFGISDYQGILARHQKLIKISHIKIPKKGIVIDIGANVGFFSKLIRDLYPNSYIYIIEPIPAIFRCLQENFQGDKNVRLFNIAISNKTGNEKMDFNSQRGDISKISSNGKVEVKAETLDDFVDENRIEKIDLLKIDTEGFEELVLKSAEKTLSKTRYLFIEITIKNNSNYTIASLMSHLYSKKFNFNLLAFRNFGDTGEGEAPILDCLMKNMMLD